MVDWRVLGAMKIEWWDRGTRRVDWRVLGAIGTEWRIRGT
jgi:hypothetical protein